MSKPMQIINIIKQEEEVKLMELTRKLNYIGCDLLKQEEPLIKRLSEKYNLDKSSVFVIRDIQYLENKFIITTNVGDTHGYCGEDIVSEISIDFKIKEKNRG